MMGEARFTLLLFVLRELCLHSKAQLESFFALPWLPLYGH